MLTTAEFCVTAAVISLQYHQPSLFAYVTITASRIPTKWTASSILALISWGLCTHRFNNEFSAKWNQTAIAQLKHWNRKQ